MVSLREFLEFAAENVVHAQRLRDFPSNVAAMRAPGIYIRFLQQNQVRWRAAQKFEYPVQLLPAVDVPADHPDRRPESAGIGWGKERPCFKLFHHVSPG